MRRWLNAGAGVVRVSLTVPCNPSRVAGLGSSGAALLTLCISLYEVLLFPYVLRFYSFSGIGVQGLVYW